MNEFEKARQSIARKTEEARLKRLGEEETRRKSQEEQRLKKISEENERKLVLEKRDNRLRTLPRVQKQSIDFLREINLEIFSGKGKIQEWRKETRGYSETRSENHQGQDHDPDWTDSWEVECKKEHLIASLKISKNQTLDLSIPLRLWEKGSKVWNSHSDMNYEASRIEVGDVNCKIPFSDEEWNKFRSDVIGYVGDHSSFE
ncbi:hypothetical protein BH10PAT1_BH10PAT1_3510 [soil metagenome]